MLGQLKTGFSALLFLCSINVFGQVNIIPKPVNLTYQSGVFHLSATTSIQYNTKQSSLKTAVSLLSERIIDIAGFVLPINAKTKTAIQLELVTNNDIGQEGYLMDISTSKIRIQANSAVGIVYGLQSLFQVLPSVRTNAKLTLPCLTIIDYPRFSYRGMHLDVSRHFFSVDFVKTYIDLIAQYKMNTFHWHLVDDQGWRIEIKKYPELTNIGAWRVDHTNKLWSNRPQAKSGEAATYGGYYTQDQIKDIVAYASKRNVTIIPEIEMPGHVASAIAAYPFLSCDQNKQLPLTGGDYTGISSNYCAGNDSVFTFLDNVLTEVALLFPSKYIHIGGDEVDKKPWSKCAKCKARKVNEQLQTEDQLQSYFINRIEKILIKKNKNIIGWDEILEGGLAPNATVMSWRGEAGGVEAAKMKHSVIMTPGKPVYFDHYQTGPEGEPFAIGGMNTLKNVYDYEPIPKELNFDQAKYVKGAQANLWTEYITTVSQAEYMVLPRMAALAEVVWTKKEHKNWDDFYSRLQQHFDVYGQKGLNFSSGNYLVNIKPQIENGKLQVSLSSEIPNSSIYYTKDGTEPQLNSAKYLQPFLIDQSAILKAVTVVGDRKMGFKAASQTFNIHTAVAKNVVYMNPVSSYYLADGPNTLTDGIRGTAVIGKHWHGFYQKDLIATIDLGDEKWISKISLGCLQNYNDWILLPQKVIFELSINGVDFEEIDTVVNANNIYEKGIQFDFKTIFSKRTARFIRVKAINQLCPKGHSGEGKPAWIFADEIIVE
jgi:hexosaminidase